MATHSNIVDLENPLDRGAWWGTVHGVAESDTTEYLPQDVAKPQVTLNSASGQGVLRARTPGRRERSASCVHPEVSVGSRVLPPWPGPKVPDSRLRTPRVGK